MATTLYVHDEVFHADDVLCAALIKFYFDDVKIIRKRLNSLEEVNATEGENVFVLDTGNTDIVTGNLVAFDHHGKEREAYDNGIKYAACGKLFRYLVEKRIFPMNKKAVERFTRKVLWPVEVQDNGQNPSDFDITNPSLFAWVSSFNTNWDEDKALQNKRFEKVVEMAKDILEMEFKNLLSMDAADLEIELAVVKSGEDPVVNLQQFLPGWQEFIIQYNEYTEYKKKIVVFKNMSGKYNIQMVPVNFGTKDTHISCPETWLGLKNDELQKASGIKDAVFCHSTGFMAVFESEVSALAAAEKIVNLAL